MFLDLNREPLQLKVTGLPLSQPFLLLNQNRKLVGLPSVKASLTLVFSMLSKCIKRLSFTSKRDDASKLFSACFFSERQQISLLLYFCASKPSKSFSRGRLFARSFHSDLKSFVLGERLQIFEANKSCFSASSETN